MYTVIPCPIWNKLNQSECVFYLFFDSINFDKHLNIAATEEQIRAQAPVTNFLERMNDKAGGGVPRRVDICRSSSRPTSYRRRGAGSALFGFICGLCVFLSLLCSCLAALVVVMNDKVQSASELSGEKIKKSYIFKWIHITIYNIFSLVFVKYT